MLVHGGDCFIAIKTSHVEMDVPYSNETIREAVSMLYEESAIEGSGTVKAIRKPRGVTGCVVTPLTIGTAPLLLYLAMGGAGLPLFVSGTRDLYQYRLSLLPMSDTERFDLIQDRGGERRVFEGCIVKAFELRIIRGEAVKLKLNITGESPPAVYPYTDVPDHEQGERFSGDCVTYTANGREYKNIYGVTLVSEKENGTKTELWIRRALEHDADIPEIVDELSITAQLQRKIYEERRYGMFKITMKHLVKISDETEIDTSGAVIGPLKFYVAGNISTEVYTSGETNAL